MRMMTEGGDWCRPGDCSLDDHQADYLATAHRQAENACCPHGRPSMAAAAHFFFTNSTTCPVVQGRDSGHCAAHAEPMKVNYVHRLWCETCIGEYTRSIGTGADGGEECRHRC